MSTASAAAGLVQDRTHIDWLTVTHDKRDPLEAFLEGPTETMPRGFSMYRSAMRDGYGAVLAWDGPEERPALLTLPGKALAQWRARHQDVDLIFRLAFDGVHCTRLDLARDTAGPWTPYRLREHIESGRYVSQWRRFTYHCGQGGEALTVDCGSRLSDVFLRVYDKRAEMLARGEACALPQLSRWEFEIKGERAAKAFTQLSMLECHDNPDTGEWTWPLGGVHTGWLRSRLVLTETPVDRKNKNQRRARPHSDWTDFLKRARDCVLAPEVDERSAADQAKALGEWARRSLASSLHVCWKLGGSEAVKELIRCGGERLSAKHEMLLASADETRAAFRRGAMGDTN